MQELQIAVYRSETDILHNAECRVQNAELMKSFRSGEKIFNGIYRCLCARKIVFRYRESCVLSTAFLQLPHDCVLPMQNASFILHSAFCILHFAELRSAINPNLKTTTCSSSNIHDKMSLRTAMQYDKMS